MQDFLMKLLWNIYEPIWVWDMMLNLYKYAKKTESNFCESSMNQFGYEFC
jgi:hypothetical protein